MKGAKARDCSVVSSETGEVRWGLLMRKFSQAQTEKEKCRSTPMKLPLEYRKPKDFPTGSRYEGSWDMLGMTGYGVYTFPNGVIYEGDFEDGQFHGKGDLLYKTREILHGKFENGKMVDRQLVFEEGLEYTEDSWKYCKLPDRRYTAEYEKGVQPAKKSFITFEKPSRWIPPGYFDTGEGYYQPSTKAIYKYDDLSSIIRQPSVVECKWIEDNCRKKPKQSVGPRPDLYEQWKDPTLKQEQPPPPAAVARNTDFFEEDDAFDPEGFEWRPNRRSTCGVAGRRKSRFSYTYESRHGSISDKIDARNANLVAEMKLNISDDQ